MLKTAHQRVHRCPCASLRGVLLQPFAEGRIQRLVLGLGHEPGLLNQLFLGAQGYIFH